MSCDYPASLPTKKIKPFTLIDEERLEKECFLIRRALKCGAEHYNELAWQQEPQKNSQKTVQNRDSVESRKRNLSPPVRDRPSTDKSVKNIVLELIDKLMSKICILTEFVKNADQIARNAATVLAFSDVHSDVKRTRLSSYITRLQIKVFGLFQQLENIETSSSDELNNLVLVLRGTVRLMDELSSALHGNYTGGPLDRRIEKISVLCRRILIYCGTLSLNCDVTDDIRAIDLLEKMVKLRDNTRIPTSRDKKKKGTLKSPPKLKFRQPLHIQDIQRKDVAIMAQSDQPVSEKTTEEKIYPSGQIEESRDSYNVGSVFKKDVNTVLARLNTLEINSQNIEHKWMSFACSPKVMDIPRLKPRLTHRRPSKPKLYVPNLSVISSLTEYKDTFEAYLESINHSAISEHISPWSFAARICDKIWTECINEIACEVSDLLDDAVLAEVAPELGCSVDGLLEPAQVEEEMTDADILGIPGFFLNIKL